MAIETDEFGGAKYKNTKLMIIFTKKICQHPGEVQLYDTTDT